MPENSNKFYLTTPIYYVNARPHIGHAYSTIAADVIARRHRLLGEDTFFLTGTDEHGQKVQRSAEAAGIPPQQFADQVSGSFSGLWKRMGITNDDFIRTTDARHKRGVQHLWRQLETNGAIYLSSYTGQYCVSDEAFVDVPVGAPCPECGRITETITEENYFFRLSDFQLPLLDLIESGQLHIQPDTARNEVLSFLRGNISSNQTSSESVILSERCESKDLRLSSAGNPYLPGALKDLSISRTSFTWGIPVPASDAVIPSERSTNESVIPSERSESRDPRISPEAPQKPTEKHVVYVWLDALANYMTAIGYGSDDPAEIAKFKRFWPADLHLVGKEITRFHCLYWPAFLLALNPKLKHGPNDPMPQLTPAEHAAWAKEWLPKSIVANGWLLFEESKMSKSRGNVVRTETILDAFGTLCPPPPPPTPEAVILSAAKDPDAARPIDTARPFLPQTPAVPTQPTKAQQDLFASDVLRYFLLREIPFGQDGTFSFDALITRYNADLANGYGNLVSRVLTLVRKGLGGEFRKVYDSGFASGTVTEEDRDGLDKPFDWTLGVRSEIWWAKEPWEKSPTLQQAVAAHFENYRFGLATETIWQAIRIVDGYLSEHAPWKLIGTVIGTSESAALQTLDEILYTAAESIRIITALLYPVMPYATASVWRQLGLGDIEEAARNGELKDLKWGGLKPGTKLGPLAPIFPRADKGLAQIMTEMENPTTPATPEPATPAIPTPAVPAAVLAADAPTNNQQPTTNNSPQITIDDFAKVDLRVAQIVVAERIPKADKLLRLEVDLGPDFPRRQILAGIAEYYQPEALIGRKVVIVANLAPRKMRGLESQGMIVAASIGPAGAPVLTGFLEDVELGARLK
ncbi:MAG: methionine--tRNA ligase subunit beta [Acidobacteriaceae bacterium]